MDIEMIGKTLRKPLQLKFRDPCQGILVFFQLVVQMIIFNTVTRSAARLSLAGSQLESLLLSPFHLFLILSSLYSGKTMGAIGRPLIYPCIGLMVFTCAYFAIMKMVI